MKLGIIGGSGLYSIDGLDNIREIELKTPYGKPSSVYISGTLNGVELFFIPRHGKNHNIMPSEL